MPNKARNPLRTRNNALLGCHSKSVGNAPEPVYVNAHISDNSFIFLGIEFFGSLITLESNSFFTFLPGDGHFALSILGYRATLSGNLSFVPQYKRLVCVPTSWGDYWNPGWVEAATLNLY